MNSDGKMDAMKAATKSLLDKLKTALDALKALSLLSATTATTTDATRFTASTVTGAVPGTYSVEITALASAKS